MTLPNKLSLSRILLIPFFLIAMLWGGGDPAEPFPAAIARAIALVIVIVASITDWLDGKIAREQNIITNLGKLLDPLADKLLVAAAFVGFVEMGIYAAWPVVLILCREFLITGLRTLAALTGRVVSADSWGKHKTGWQLATIITALVFLTARESLRAAGLWDGLAIGTLDADAIIALILDIMMLIVVFLTVVSGVLYLRNNWALVDEAG
ncbi:MAG: CDP-diacylglycerol---glycerol-3-phosphate 3-phosphatidyltransferase [Candidatus Sumerlaeota bacterium]|nr:CDP-diacylglycerol---glycerol-3-phosphate 3-phosphatidyltransferase [Candidatus Sumerlaeota bacterium]